MGEGRKKAMNTQGGPHKREYAKKWNENGKAIVISTDYLMSGLMLVKLTLF